MESGAGAVFALLDDCDSTASARSSRLYLGFAHERVCTDPRELDAVCAAVQDDLRQGLHALVVGDYAFGRDLQWGPASSSGSGALRFVLFRACRRLSRDEAGAWLAERDGGAPEPSAAGVAYVEPSVSRAEFDTAIAAIHDALRAGDSYQVNFTYRLGFDVFGTPLALYRRLRVRQPVRYGALLALPGDEWVLSCSPELFVEKTGGLLRARPMKGTAPRLPDPVLDQATAAGLARDVKNRAENLMIVDLLRNDLSRIARTGSVRVPALFSVEPYASVWQMTSTVEAQARADADFAAILRALFPCGSITGAPKYKTMQLIDALESTPRGLYTGTIGWLDAPAANGADVDAVCGDFCLSVAIRTLTLEAADAAGRRRGEMGVGAGIVLDSVAADEYAECALKARFLTGAEPGFELFETLHATREDGVRHLARHLARLGDSARAFGFRFDEGELRARLDACCADFAADGPHRVRAALSKDGRIDVRHAPLQPLAEPFAVLFADEHGFAPLDACDPLLAHKTTRRAYYDRAWQLAETHGAFDMLFFNTRGELAEGGRSNVFVKLDGRWYTPPLAAGVLPGVMRGVLLEDSRWQAAERTLTRDDLLNAEAIVICNSLRGALPARLVSGAK